MGNPRAGKSLTRKGMPDTFSRGQLDELLGLLGLAPDFKG